MIGKVVAVASSRSHTFSKPLQSRIHLISGLGVEGDAHCGTTVKHRSHVARDPNRSNLRQVHLIHAELLAELASQGFAVEPGQLGENITTQGINLLGLPTGTHLVIGESAVVTVTGLRNPCSQLDQFQQGLLAAVLTHDDNGNLVRKSGIMGIVAADGVVNPGDTIRVELPDPPLVPLSKV